MSELCTLAASVVLQSQNTEPSRSPEQSSSEIIEVKDTPQPSVGCDGHRAIEPSIAPETHLDAGVDRSPTDDLEFSQGHPDTITLRTTAVSQPVLRPLVTMSPGMVSLQPNEDLFAPDEIAPTVDVAPSSAPVPTIEADFDISNTDTSILEIAQNVAPDESASENTALKGYSRDLMDTEGSQELVPRIPVARPLPQQHQTKPGKKTQVANPVGSQGIIDHGDSAASVRWSNGQQSTTVAGWPSLLYPSSEPAANPSANPPSSHQSALPDSLVPSSLDSLVLRSPTISPAVRPRSGRQLFQQRWAALRAGRTYTRLPTNSFEQQWKYASYAPTYEDWLYLLSREARSMARGQGQNALTVIVGDSLSLWMPTEFLPQHQFWLNQSISGETAAGMVKRLHMFDQTRPNTIHVMAGINDLKNGATDAEVLSSLRTMMQQLRYKHPQAEVIIHSILPTRLPHLPSDRIRLINQQLAQISQQEGSTFLDLQGYFSDARGHLRQDLTTDGLHLNYRGYTMWQAAMAQI